MSPLAIGAGTFVLTAGGALLGVWLRRVLPAQHLGDDARDTMKLAIGLVATLTALVLGLVTASTKSTFDDLNTTIKRAAIDVLELDHTLARYGPETRELRAVLKRVIEGRIEMVWSRNASMATRLDTARAAATLEGLLDQVRALTPETPVQRAMQSRALDQGETLLKTRWAVLGGLASSVPWPFLTVLLCWLTIIFTCFGMLAPRNSTVLSVLIVCALSVALAVFLVLEMDGPFDGVIQISPAPMRYALSRLGL